MTRLPGSSADSTERPAGRTIAGRPQRAAFTLLELLVVLGLILAIGAISLPTVLDGVERRRFDSAIDDAIGTLRLARAHARLESITIEVVAIEDSDSETRLLARAIDLARFAADDAEGSESTRAIGEPWAERVLAVRLVADDEDSPPESDGERPAEIHSTRSSTETRSSPADPLAIEGALEGEIEGAGRGRSRPRATRIAIFASDGSAPVVAALRLRDDHGRRATVRVNPWTGLAALDRGVGAGPAFEPISDSPGESTAPAENAAPRAASTAPAAAGAKLDSPP